jgi:hypothetical protein
LIEPSTVTTSNTWSTNGTGLGVNAPSGFTGNLLDLQVNGTGRFNVTPNGFGFANPVSSKSFFVFQSFANNAAHVGVAYETRPSPVAALVTTAFSEGILSCNNSGYVGWLPTDTFSNYTSWDLRLYRDIANTLAQRNNTNAQTLRVYDTFASATDYHRIAIATARATLSAVSGASVTATGLIPAGAVVMGVTSKVTTALGTGNGTTGYKIGTAADDDRWGAITGTATGTTSDNRDWTVGTIECFPAATDVIVTATGGNFNGTGVIYLSVQYMAGQAD